MNSPDVWTEAGVNSQNSKFLPVLKIRLLPTTSEEILKFGFFLETSKENFFQSSFDQKAFLFFYRNILGNV